MPKLIWKLKDPKSCEGCMFAELQFIAREGEKVHKRRLWCYVYGRDTTKTRSQVCIDELGE